MNETIDLRRQLEARLLELASLPAVLAHRDDIARRPTDAVLANVRISAESLMASPDCKLRSLNISATQDGHVLFSLDGPYDRDIDLWIHDSESDASWVADQRIDRSSLQTEGRVPFDRCGELLAWLFSEGPLQ